MDHPSFDMRKIHLRLLIEEGLSLKDWEAFVSHFETTLDELQDIPAESKASALAWLKTTKDDFRPADAAEVEAYKAAKAAGGAHHGHQGGSCPFK